jgi:hypothetical protein
MSEKRTGWIWNRLRGKKREELDRIQKELVMGPGEKRPFAGDPSQLKYLRIKLKNK